MWRDQRRHRWLLNIIDHLPRESAFVEAMAHDTDVAEGIVSGRIPVADDAAEQDTGPRSAEWNLQVEMLAQILDRLGTIVTAVLAGAGSKQPPKFKPSQRPDPPVAKAIRRRKRLAAERKADEIARLFAPHAFTDDPPS